MNVIIAVAWGGIYPVPILSKLFNSPVDIINIFSQGVHYKKLQKITKTPYYLNFKNNVLECIQNSRFADKYTEIKSLNDDSTIEFIKNNNVDYIFCIGYGEILKPAVIKAVKSGIINFHPGLLPENQGADPFSSVIYYNLPKTGFTIHYIDEGIDTGEIILQKELETFDKQENYNLLQAKMGYLGVSMIDELLSLLSEKNIKSRPQPPNQKKYYKKLPDEVKNISFDDSALNIVNKVKCFSNRGGSAYFQYKNYKIYVNQAEEIYKNSSYGSDCPGRIIDNGYDYIIISAKDSDLLLNDFYVENYSKEISIQLLKEIICTGKTIESNYSDE